MSDEDEKWIKQHRTKNDLWNIFFLQRENGWREKAAGTKTAKTMSRDILDAKKNRIIEGPFSKNPHLAELSSMMGLKIAGKKMTEAKVKDLILSTIKVGRV